MVLSTFRFLISKGKFCISGILLLLLFFAVLATETNAAISKVITINTTPQGAQVTHLKGTRRIPVGISPVEFQAKFHSDKSALRIELNFNGYEKKVIKVKSIDDSINVPLEKQNIVANSKSIKDKKAKILQEKSEKTLKSIFAKFNFSENKSGVFIKDKVRFVKKNKKYLLKVPLSITDSKISNSLAKKIWGELFDPLIYPLSQALNKNLGQAYIQLDIASVKDDIEITAESQIETRVEMECVGGTISQYVYNACASSRTECSGGFCRSVCQPGSTMQQVWNACASRVPVTYTDHVIVTDATFDPTEGLIRFDINTKEVIEVNDPNRLFQIINPKVFAN